MLTEDEAPAPTTATPILIKINYLFAFVNTFVDLL
jgi:hypothetical protein